MNADPDDLDDGLGDLEPIVRLLRRVAADGRGALLGTVPPGQASLRRVAQPSEELSARFTEAYRQERPALLRLAGARLGSRNAAEDVVQRAFTSVWRQLQRPDRPEIASLARYTCTAVTREVHRELRVLIPERRRADDDEVDRPDPASIDESSSPLIEALEDALVLLAPRLRQAVVLRFQTDRDVRQTAELMGVSEGAVKRYTADGLARLRELLGDHPFLPGPR